MLWTREEFKKAALYFHRLYENRPIENNAGGMKSPHLFPLWFLIRKLQPKYIIESGVWKGQGTWFMEKAAPQARIFCLDPNLKRLVYKSKKAVYSRVDFAKQDWSHLPKDETLVFFDDHQNALERVKTARAMGFRHLMFEDNYPPGRGDAYSLKKVLAGAGHRPQLYYPGISAISLMTALKVYFFQMLSGLFIPPNRRDAEHLEGAIEIYYEFPPVIKPEKTRWGDAWTEPQYLTPDPLFTDTKDSKLEVFKNEGRAYNWICYVKLR